MVIGIHDEETLSRVDVISKCESVIVNKRLCDVGSIEINGADRLIDVGKVIYVGGFGGIVIEIYEDGISRKTKLICKDLKCMTERRVLEKDFTFTNIDALNVLNQMLTHFLKAGDRNIPYVTINAPEPSYITVDEYTFVQGDNLADALKEFCETYNVGYDFEFDEKTVKCVYLSKKQNNRCVFDTSGGYINDIEYQKSISEFKNVVYYEIADEVKTDGTAKGIKRFEGFCDKPEEIDAFFAENTESESLTANASERYRYGVDYNLGDDVIIANENFETRKMISEIEIVYEKGKTNVVPTFGKQKENKIKKLLKG